jgi:hypothetical protein
VSQTLTQSVRRQAVRELMGKILTKDPDVTEVIYLSEIIRFLECQRTVPMGIEMVTVRKIGDSKKVLRHQCFCRAHGYDYEMRV